MFARRGIADKLIGQAGLRMVAQDDLRVLTSQVKVGLLSIGKKGAEFLLDSPFIDGSHVLMDVHNITPKWAMVLPWSAAGEDAPSQGLIGEVVRFNRLDREGQVRFLLEVAWVPAGPVGEERARLLKRVAKPVREEAS